MTCHTTHHACDCVLKRMAKLEEKFIIAVEALEYYASQDNGLFADKALKKIGEVK